MAGSRAARALRRFRRHRQQLWLAPLPEPSRQSMAWHTEAAQPKATTVVGSLQRSSARQPSAAAPARSHLARASDLKRDYSSEEPDAGKLQVRICGGGGGRPPPLPDQCRRDDRRGREARLVLSFSRLIRQDRAPAFRTWRAAAAA